ncbi:MAG TPA: hypothetical protein VLY87_04760 [Flavobacterium sp.]|nr:hypothetical protein [Flavobacterium sp.]
MLKLACSGQSPIDMPDGSTRTLLTITNMVIMKVYCEKDEVRISFGDISAQLLLVILFEK